MKTIRDPSQQRLFDPYQGVLSDTGRKHIAAGWQSMFRDSILELMPVGKISQSFSDDSGRRSAELHAMIGLLLIRDIMGWTVPEAHESILFRADIQYALNLEPGVDISQRTIERYLARVQDDPEISQEIFTTVTDLLLQSLEVKVKKQRLDSTHVLSDMSQVGRARMIGLALKRFFAKVHSHAPNMLARFSDELLKRYRKQSDGQIFGDARTTEKRRLALQQAAEDLLVVIKELDQVCPIRYWRSFVMLKTIFSQQCELREEFVEVLEKTGGNVILNTSDPDAGFSGHKGPGYSAQLVETHNAEGDDNFITAVIVQDASGSDANAVQPILEDLKTRGRLPEELAADSAYGGDANVQHAREQKVELLAPVAGSKKYDADEIGYDQFELNQQQEVLACPAGHSPESTSYSRESDRTWAKMDASRCQGCPLLDRCPVQRNGKTKAPNGRVQFQSSAVRAAKRRRYEQTQEFRDRYRWRSGIEGTNSCLKRKLKMARLRVRGLKAVTTAIMFKVTGWNILRAVSLRSKRLKSASMAAV